MLRRDVADINDNAPVISPGDVAGITVSEDAAIGTQLGAPFTADDIDSGENAIFQ